MGKNKRAKYHHYIPRFYLFRFCREEMFWLFDRERNVYRHQSPIRTAAENEYYSFDLENGEKTSEVEDLLAEIEGPVNPILEKLEARNPITDVEKSNLATFIALLKTRTPDFRSITHEIGEILVNKLSSEIFRNEKTVESAMKRYEDENGISLGISAAEMLAFDKANEFDVSFPNQVPISQMLNTGMELQNILIQMDWEIFHTAGKFSFLTTDNPFAVVPSETTPPGSYGIGTIGTKKIVPLSQSMCLVMGDKGPDIRHLGVDGKGVRRINELVVQQAFGYVFGRDQKLVESLVKKVGLDKSKIGKRLHKRI